MTESKSLESERDELMAANEAATSWGAAVGARSERIKEIDQELRRLAAEGEQKPVEWQFQDARGKWTICGEPDEGDFKAHPERLRPLYAAPQPAPGWDEAIEAAKSEILRLTKEWGKPTGSHGQQAIKAHGDRLYLAVEALLHSSQSTSDAGGGVREATIRECVNELQSSYPGHAWLNAACAALRALSNPAAADSNASADDYRNAIDEALVVRYLGVAKGDAKAELNQILSWEVMVALDPRVSFDAQALIDQGRNASAEALEDCQTHRRAWRKALEMALAANPPQAWDVSDALYWSHELEAFDRTFAALSPDPHASDSRCQCEACKTVSHASSCAVHNDTAYPNGPCDCEKHGDWVVRKNGYFYRPKAQGYTACLCEAGRWPEADARAYTVNCEGVTAHPASEFSGPSDRPVDVKCEACFGTGRHMGRFSTNDPDCTYCRGKGKVRP